MDETGLKEHRKIEVSVFMRGTIPWLRDETMRVIIVQIRGPLDELGAGAVMATGVNRILARENRRDEPGYVEVVFVEEALGEPLLEAIEQEVLREEREERRGADSFGVVTVDGKLIVRRSRSHSPRNFLGVTEAVITEKVEEKTKQSA